MAAAAGAVAALILTQLIYGKADLTMVLNGALAGLVSITAEPLAPSLGLALIIGAIGGADRGPDGSDARQAEDRRRRRRHPGPRFRRHLGHLAVVLTGGYHGEAALGTQILGMVAIIGTTFVLSLIVWFILKAVMGIRVSEEAELEGLDVAELGMEAYPDFTKG
jgi:Amt family ammonium transporter